MSILTAIFQAIFQAITFILPISENGHSSMFHDFAGRVDSSPAALTGIIHIGIGIGIIIAMYKIFLSLFNEFFFTIGDIFKKQLKAAPPKPARKFMYYTLLSFAPMILWLIPLGKKGFLYNLLRSSGFNGNLLDDGLFFVATGVLIIFAAKQVMLSRNNKNINLIYALIIGAASLILVPVAGLSFIGGVFCILMLLGVSKKVSLRYAFVLSPPVLITMGIIEIITSANPAGIAAIIIALILSAAVSFFCVRLFRWIVDNDKLKYFGYYDIALGVIAAVIGVFELILK